MGKVLWFTGFHPNVGKPNTVFVLKMLKKAVIQTFIGMTLVINQKYMNFSYTLTYVIYGYILTQHMSKMKVQVYVRIFQGRLKK